MRIISVVGAGSGLLSARDDLTLDEDQTRHVLKISAANITCRRSVKILACFCGFGRLWVDRVTDSMVSRNGWRCKECET